MASLPGGQARGAAIRTFLIADIRGYTRFTAQHGDEAASRLATTFAEVALEGVEAWGGELVELRGDEALAVFDSPRGALRAAVELQSAFADETASDPALPLGVGIGLDVGEAVPVGDGYRGGALNLAARMCAIAAAGEVLASEGLVRLAGRVDGLGYKSLEPTTFKGYDEPIAAVRVSGTEGLQPVAGVAPPPSATEPPPLPPELDPIVPLAGRAAELRWLAWHWRRARHGHGRTLVLSGPPGIGKTRLAAELATQAHAAGATVVFVPAARLDPMAVPAAAPADGPVLTIVDDLDAAAADAVAAFVERAPGIAGRPAMTLVIHRREAPPALVALAERLAPPEQRRTIGPIDAEAVRSIVALYAGGAVETAPIDDLLGESGGFPAAVHRVASRWARTSAAGRLGSSAERTETGRRGLRAAEAALVGDVADLEWARERERRYAIDPDEIDGAGVAAGLRTVCPYKGLAEFEAADADYYFGRERLVAELIARFVGGSFLGLVGDSGSGKSSALRAGLLPALAGGVLPGSAGWPQAIFRPGEHPLAELGRALARALPASNPPALDAAAALDAALGGLATGARLVLVVDQFEEVFNATRDEAERSAFIGLLTAERTDLRVIVSMRADHYGRCAAYPALARLLGSDQVLVGPLSGAEIAAVIEQPAQRVGLRVEPALTAALVADAGIEPGVLPLLSTALLELWQARDAGRLTLAAYRASGGLQGAIARLAEATYTGLDPHRQAVARALLLRLAGPGEGSELVRRRVALDELDPGSDPVLDEVLATLTAARLLTAGEGHVEVAHEALLREWPRLQGWLADDAAGRQVRLHLIGAVADWQRRGREPGDLYRGARLAAALDWAGEHQVDLNAAERSFLDESRLAAERDVERQRRMNRRLRVLLAGAAALLVIAVAAGGIAALQGQRATDEARNATDQKVLAQQAADNATKQQQLAEQQSELAQQRAREARSRELIASALAAREKDGSLAKLLAVESLNGASAPTTQATNVLRQVLAADPVIARYSWPVDQPVDWLWTDLAPDGKQLVASGQVWTPTSHLEVADPRTGTVLWSYPTGSASAASGSGFIGPSFFSADGSQVIAGLHWTDPEVAPPAALGVAIWDAGTGKLDKLIDVGPCGGTVVAVSKRRLLVRTPTPVPDGRPGCDWSISEYQGHAPVLVVDPVTGAVTKVADTAILFWGGTMSGNGRFVGYDLMEPGACGAPSCWTSVVVDLDNHMKRVFRLEADSSAHYATYARLLNYDGTLLLYGDGPMLAYEIPGSTTATVRPVLSAPGGVSGWAEFDPSGQTVYETSGNAVLRRWNPRTGEVLATWPAIANGRPKVAADGRTVLVGGTGPAGAVLLDSAIRGDLGEVAACSGFTFASSLHVGAGLAAFDGDCPGPEQGTVQVVDLAKKELLGSWNRWGAQGLAISPDGGSFVSQSLEPPSVTGPPTVVALRTGRPIVELQGVCRVDFSLPGPVEEQPGCHAYPQAPFPFSVDNVQWSPDGTMIAAGDGLYGYVAVWDARDGRLLFSAPPRATPTQILMYLGVPTVIFTPDSKRLLVAYAPTQTDPAGTVVGTGIIETLSTATWTVISTTSLAPSVFGSRNLGFVGYTPDGSTLVAVSGLMEAVNATLVWLDAATLQVKDPGPVVLTQLIRAAALSPDGSLLATGGGNGVLSVWNAKTGGLDQQMDFGASQVQGVSFIDNRHLAVTPQYLDLLIMTVDHAELADIVRASLTRTFTALECTTYGIAPCPTLEQMRAP